MNKIYSMCDIEITNLKNKKITPQKEFELLVALRKKYEPIISKLQDPDSYFICNINLKFYPGVLSENMFEEFIMLNEELFYQTLNKYKYVLIVNETMTVQIEHKGFYQKTTLKRIVKKYNSPTGLTYKELIEFHESKANNNWSLVF